MSLRPPALTFDSLEVGQRDRSHGRTLTEHDLALGCMITGGWHPIHADAAYAATTPLGQRILHGNYGLLIATGLAFELPDLGRAVITDLGLSNWRYLKPLFIGQTVHADVEIIAKRITSDPSRGVLERRIRLVDTEGAILQEGVSALLVRRR